MISEQTVIETPTPTPGEGPLPITRAETQIIADHPAPHVENQSQITRVLVISLDSSIHSQYAFQWSIENFIKPESDLVVLVNVRPVATIPSPYGTSYMDFTDYLVQIEEQHRIASHLLLQAYAQRLKKKHISVKAIAMRGDPRDEVVRKVTELDADVLIMGSRGMGALKRAFIGSVSDVRILITPDHPLLISLNHRTLRSSF
ncbi:hypothetical protein HDU93_001362 [Gonapodya sp. JEL0774]|nr:hypothetical protein HDU93_001362 [Gonapodya sp. JEL0774]